MWGRREGTVRKEERWGREKKKEGKSELRGRKRREEEREIMKSCSLFRLFLFLFYM